MDPLTHALTGAAVAYAASGRTIGRRALVVGAAAGLLPDLDVLIRSSADPLLAIEHHRGFTHSIVFALAGGTAVGVVLGRRSARTLTIAAAILAWLSHAFLDAATTYGTQLFWPFSRFRVGLDIISILDPLFTLTVLAGVIAAFRGRRSIVAASLSLRSDGSRSGSFSASAPAPHNGRSLRSAVTSSRAARSSLRWATRSYGDPSIAAATRCASTAFASRGSVRRRLPASTRRRSQRLPRNSNFDATSIASPGSQMDGSRSHPPIRP